MDINNVLGVCSFLGTSGYNYHSRGFFTALNKYLPVGIKNWSGDNNPYYLTNEHNAMMAASRSDAYLPGKCISICLHESNHHDWYNYDFKSPSIAFNVWESTRQPDNFLKKMMEFDQIWVPSKWQKNCTIEQGCPESKIFVIPEGIDTNRFNLINTDSLTKFSSNDKFTFTIAGRWEYRKSTTEIIKSFIELFGDNNNVELLLLVDNPFDRKKLTTEDKLSMEGLKSKNIKIIHKIDHKDYDLLIRETDCFLSCSRAEGWGLPLQEFMACGVPAICSNGTAQLEFAENFASLVNIKCFKSAWSEFGAFPGEYPEPDYDHLKQVMLNMVDSYSECKVKAMEGAKYMERYTWDNAAKIALETMQPLMNTEVNEAKKGAVCTIGTNDIIVIDCFPNTEDKINKLRDTINYVKKFNKPVAVVTHLNIPNELISLVDYYIFDADNTLPDYRLPLYCSFNSVKLKGRLDRPYHSLPIVKSLQNVCKLLSNYDRIHFIEYDININLEKHFKNVAIHNNMEFVGYSYERRGVYTNIMSFTPKLMMDILSTKSVTWDDYKDLVSPMAGESDLIFEYWVYKRLNKIDSCNKILESSSIDMEKDSFKELPKVNFIFSVTKDGSNILFIVHMGNKSSMFTVNATSKLDVQVNLDLDLIDCGGYSYVIFDSNLVFVDITETTDDGNYFRYFNVDNEEKGEFIFYGEDVKNIVCSNLSYLSNSNACHDVQVNNFFIKGPFLEIKGSSENKNTYQVSFTDRLTGQVVHNSSIKINCWTRANREYYTDWNTKVVCNDGEVVYNNDLSLKGRRVFVVLDSKAIGDSVAWFPMLEEFRVAHGAEVICSSFWNKFFEKTYPNISFISPGCKVENIYAQFNIGCFDTNLHKNKVSWRIIPLQQVASDILGIEYKEVIPNISYKIKKRSIEGKYVAVSEHSTFLSKHWLKDKGWDTVVSYLKSKGYKVAAISKEPSHIKGVVDLTGRNIEDSLSNIHHADLFIGVSSGPSWLAWALKRPLVLISGYSSKWAEMDCNNPLVSRVINKKVCHGCFNDPSLELDKGDWHWCPRNRNHECSKMISVDMVIEAINKQLSI